MIERLEPYIRWDFDDVIEKLNEVINAVNNKDTVPVVRCKDCKHRDPEDHKCNSGALERAGCIFPVADDYFCSCGERRG